MAYKHIPVMLEEVMRYLDPQPGGYFIDCTMGGGGYTRAIADKVGAGGRVISIDMDEMAVSNLKTKTKKIYSNITFVHDNFKNLSSIVKRIYRQGKIPGFDGIIYDLGLSSAQLEDRSRGFSFKLAEAPLNMAFSRDENDSTERIVNEYGQAELEEIIRTYGEEAFARNIARNIVIARKQNRITTVGELTAVIGMSVPAKFRHKQRLDPSTKTFQALRIATNRELESLKASLAQAAGLLAPGGRLGVISYHSLEDRIVKEFFKKESTGCHCPPEFPVCRCGHEKILRIIIKKPLIPTPEEIAANPRSRSAKMRVAEKIKKINKINYD